MQKAKPVAKDVKKHPAVQREAMDELKDFESSPRAVRNDVKYVDPNRDRARGAADRTGRHFDERDEGMDEGTAASKDHEAD